MDREDQSRAKLSVQYTEVDELVSYDVVKNDDLSGWPYA
jgi:hypothetical protein